MANHSSAAAMVVDETSEARNNARLKIIELANLISVPMSLTAIVRLKVPEAIWSNGSNTPVSAAEILSRLPDAPATADAENLQRLLRVLTSFGVFSEHLDTTSSSSSSTSERRYCLTEVGQTLVSFDESCPSHGAYVLQHHQETLLKAWPFLHTAILDASTEPFARVNGEPAYQYYGKNDELNKNMQYAMSGVSVPYMKALLGSGYDGFEGVKTLVDVGGSSGDCLRMIINKYKDIPKAINFDLPEVVAKAPKIPGITHVGGNMFESVPSGDAIFVKWVLTCFTDEEVITLMRNCNKALPVGGKLICSEPTLPENSDESHRTRALLVADIFIMTTYRAKGKHRTEEEYRQLGLLAGFPKFRVIHVDYFFPVVEFQK
uniref:S-adenosyl-L-methionine: beta-alanine N-methyltransferase n=3 Tax=Limonium latifolium TaxID=227291 RepID=Q84N56_9CARY|nr:S-adenosyl-L-methionine: beta-alanine N-methyltransferase [Limonium latifolium]